MGERLREEDEVAGGQRDLHDQLPRRRAGGRSGLVAARDAAEPAAAGRVVDQRPLHRDQAAVDLAVAHHVVLRRIERGGATVQAQPAGAGRHHDAVRVVEADEEAAQLEDDVEDGRVVDQLPERRGVRRWPL